MHNLHRLGAGLLALLVILYALPVTALETDIPAPSEVSVAAESLPEEPVPDESIPEESVPEESVPEESIPEESVPEESVPEESIPEESVPEESVPEESIPEESAPEESVPEESAPEESAPEESIPEESEPVQPITEGSDDPGLYFGLLNGHSSISEGSASAEELFSLAMQKANMDFFAIADHSDSFDHHDQGVINGDGSIVSTDWTAGKAAAQAASSDSFSAIFGYEMSWPAQMKLGHISTFGTPGFQSCAQEAYRSYDGALENYYDALSSVQHSVSQFNHPGKQYGTFNSFSNYSEAADRAINLLELDFSETTPFRYYTKALDQGWHVAPTTRQEIFGTDWRDTGARTVVYARAVTESAILNAMKNRYVYATEDPNLEILYSMDGCFMGSRLDPRHVGETADISVSLRDPDDSAIGLVEIITNNAQSIARQTLDVPHGTLNFTLPPASGYYFLQITQPDGDRAVSAPIWVDSEEELGIHNFSCETSVPIRNEPVSLVLELFNGESADFIVDSLEILADGTTVTTDRSLTGIPAKSTLCHDLSLSFDCTGLTQIAVRLSGTLDGSPRILEAALDLSFRQSDQVTAIVADGSHGNAALEDLTILRQMAMDENIRLTVQSSELSAELLKDCRFLLVTAPSQPFSDTFLSAAAEFAGFGGSIVLCGQSKDADTGLSSAAELNRLLSAIGSTIRISSDTVQDPVNNSGSPTLLNSDKINMLLGWCEGISPNQVYRVSSGATVSCGQGAWMVNGRSTTVSSADDSTGSVTLMACEPLSGGGTVFAAGSLFLADENMEEAKNIWDEPYANRIFARNLLNIGGKTTPLSTIAQARAGGLNTLFRIQGYVTAGTSNPYNTFPDTLYIQDETGGIAITPFPGESVQQGTPVEITGYSEIKNGNRILKLSAWRVLEDSMYQYQPLTGSWDTLLDPAVNGSRLIQVEGTCQEVYCREDDTLAGCLLTDEHGNTATVTVEDHIFNGSDGKNELHQFIRSNRTIRAVGLLHIDDYGNTVIRVRNCEEVVYVPPRRQYSMNPRTSDIPPAVSCVALPLSLAGLLLLKRRKKT